MSFPFKCRSAAWLSAGVLSAAAAVGMLSEAAPVSTPSEITVAPTAIRWNAGADSQIPAEATPAVAQNHANSLSEAFRAASAEVIPAVVTIQSMGKAATSTAAGSQQVPDELQNHPFFKRFFEDMPEGSLRSPQQRPQPKQQGTGSGVIVDSKGIILTNNHVVAGAEKLIVKLHDGRELVATDWKTDPMTDIAIVVVDAGEDLPAANVGDSDALQIGDWVIAVGAPFGLNETVTAGIISAKARGIGITDREEFLQTDAAINPGNSGGPLVDLNGNVVGINTAISTTSGGYQGIGFAVPINLARWIGDQLAANGSVQRAFLGVGIQAVTSTLSEQFGLDDVYGAAVTEVRPNSPAAQAGLKTGDVIVEFDGRSIRTPRDLQGVVEQASVSETHRLVIVRNGERQTLDVGVSAMPGESVAETTQPQPSAPTPTSYSELGVEVSELTPELASQLQLSESSGVLVTGVRPGSPAAAAGLSSPMVISRVGDTDVRTVEEFRQAVDQASLSKGVLLLVKTAGGSKFIVLKSEELS